MGEITPKNEGFTWVPMGFVSKNPKTRGSKSPPFWCSKQQMKFRSQPQRHMAIRTLKIRQKRNVGNTKHLETQPFPKGESNCHCLPSTAQKLEKSFSTTQTPRNL